jgi:hypothetical protein
MQWSEEQMRHIIRHGDRRNEVGVQYHGRIGNGRARQRHDLQVVVEVRPRAAVAGLATSPRVAFPKGTDAAKVLPVRGREKDISR